MKRARLILVLTALVLTSLMVISEISFAKTSFRTSCIWSPKHPEVCAARNDCKIGPRHANCSLYCHVNPRDVVCGDVYQPTLPPTQPGIETPYPWGRSGSFCQQNPGHIGCQTWPNYWPNY